MVEEKKISFIETMHHSYASCRLSADDLVCRRGGRLVFADISFSVMSGQTFVLTGDNGAGKTSLLRLICGLGRLEAGRIMLSDGADIAVNSHYIGHLDGLKKNLTVAQTVQIQTRLYGGVMSELAHQSLSLLGLDGLQHRFIADLSAGQRRRLALARLMIAPRRLWLLDEPLTALDKDGCALVTQLAHAHMAKGGMIMIASHDAVDFAHDSINLSQESRR